MKHGISEETWLQYIDERLVPRERGRIDAHLLNCRECSDFFIHMIASDRALEREATLFRESFCVEPEQVHIALAQVLAKALDAEARQLSLSRRALTERLCHLEEVLATMCGSWTAINALRLAAMSSIARSPEHLTEDNWTSFLSRLTAITSVFCGETGAKLLWEHGQL